ncbi:Protein-S-isoprenylcysteine O-methyltransferase [Symbiodinium microadriaticum]|uniref:Protein-S-isoprenylcysteine O-methyltransferase n=1 Tax=Symbiodinium microadriaticum TaxID=2951 RepID=A0A1Q9DM93_SYMMI|nr:Protein-S-isoprenylcysteine O-methyltransferase [Symbiodinium microadriaticum]
MARRVSRAKVPQILREEQKRMGSARPRVQGRPVPAMAAEASEALQLVGEALGQADRALEAAMAWELRTAKAMLQTFLDQVSRRCYELEVLISLLYSVGLSNGIIALAVGLPVFIALVAVLIDGLVRLPGHAPRQHPNEGVLLPLQLGGQGKCNGLATYDVSVTSPVGAAAWLDLDAKSPIPVCCISMSIRACIKATLLAALGGSLVAGLYAALHPKLAKALSPTLAREPAAWQKHRPLVAIRMAKCRKACRACTDVNWGLAGDLSLAVLTVLEGFQAHCFYESARQLLLADSHLSFGAEGTPGFSGILLLTAAGAGELLPRTSDPPELPFHELSEGPGRRGSVPKSQEDLVEVALKSCNFCRLKSSGSDMPVQYAIDSQLELAEPLSAASHTRRKASESRYKRWVGIALSLRHRHSGSAREVEDPGGLSGPQAGDRRSQAQKAERAMDRGRFSRDTAQKALVEKEEGRLQTQRHADVVAARRKNQQLWQDTSASEMGPIEASSGQDALDDWYSDPWASPGIARKSSSSSRQGDRRGPRKTSGGLRGPEVETFCLEQLDDAPTEVADAAPLEDVSDPGGGPSEPQWQYGRCVALKLVAHSPHGNSAFEQLLPVLLTVFQVSDDERKSSFLARRRQQGSSWWSQVLRCTADKPSSEERGAGLRGRATLSCNSDGAGMVRKTNYDYDDRSDDEDFQIGDEVEIHGLQGAKELNGRTGRIVAYVEETQRFGVKLDGELENKAVRPVNLRRLDEENGASERALLEAQLAQVVEQLKAAEESGEDKSLYQRMLAELIRKLKDIDEMTEARAKQRAAAAANAAAAAAEEAAERAKKAQEDRPVLGPKPPGACKAPEGLRPPPLPREQHHPLPPKQQREKVVSDAKLELRPPVAPRPGPPPVLPQRSGGKLIPPKPSKPMYTDEHEYPDPTRAFQAGRVFAGSILCGIIASQVLPHLVSFLNFGSNSYWPLLQVSVRCLGQVHYGCEGICMSQEPDLDQAITEALRGFGLPLPVQVTTGRWLTALPLLPLQRLRLPLLPYVRTATALLRPPTLQRKCSLGVCRAPVPLPRPAFQPALNIALTSAARCRRLAWVQKGELDVLGVPAAGPERLLKAGGRPHSPARWPLDSSPDPGRQVLCLPILQRNGLPSALLASAQENASSPLPSDLLGPFVTVSVPGIEDEDAGEVPAGVDVEVLVVDLDEAILAAMRLYDPVTDLVFESFLPEAAHIMPQPEMLIAAAKAWVEEEASDRLAFYSAQEEHAVPPVASPKRPAAKKKVTMTQLSEQVAAIAAVIPSLAGQIRLVAEKQATSSAAPVAAAPQPPAGLQQAFPTIAAAPVAVPDGEAASRPRPDGSSLAKAVTQQGEALSQLVAHLIAQSETLDLTGNSTSLSAKGTAKREKLQQDLASGNTNFFLQVVQSAHRRLYPALPLPSSVEEAQASGRVSIVSYLERTGGYDRSRELGMMMMLLASIADAFLKGGNHAAREHTALALAATEQGVERGRKDESVQKEPTAKQLPSGGEDVPADTADEALQPCRALDAARLKLVGRAQRDPQPWLSDDLWMAYAEPQSLLISRTPAEDEYPDCSLEDPEQTLKLALLWDSLGLLVIVPSCLSLEGCEYTRIFNARKSAVLDRQIGDRRGRNSIEARICGPSASLPTGESLTSISIDPRTTSLAMGVTDRRDFYRQLSVDGARAVKNRLYPPLSAESLAGTKAMKLYQEPPGQRIPLTFQACFSSVLQGDHLGVEFDYARIQGGKPLRDSPVHDGLIIDDFFCIAKVPRSSTGSLSPTSSSPCRDALDRALAAYSAHSILGSPEKDTANEVVAKIGGAELNSAPATLDRGLCAAAAPAGKRFALTCVTLDVAALPGTSDSLHLCLLGAWSSVLSFRRTQSLLQRVDPMHEEGRSYFGNVCARLDWDELCRGLAILLKGRSFRVCIVAALPAATAELPDVQELLRPLGKLGIEKTPLSFCAFGSPFRRDTVLLSLRVDLAALDRPCACKRKHTQVRGRRAGRGPVYPWLFAYQVAEALSSGLRRMGREDFAWKVSHEGLERLVATDLALGLRWSPLLVWEWKSGAHINILESSALVRLYTWIAVNFGRARFVNLCDSFVAQAALGKGRSSAPGLRHVSRRSGAVCLAAGLYPGNPYCPTRAMPADHPTRDAPMPPGFGLQRWTEEAILRDAERPRLRRWAANWCRLAGLLVPSLVLGPWPNDCLLDSGPQYLRVQAHSSVPPPWPFLGPFSEPWPGFRPFGLDSVACSHSLRALRLGLTTCSSSLPSEQLPLALGFGCNPQNSCPHVFVACCSRPFSEQTPCAFSLGCNSLDQGPSTLAACCFLPPANKLFGASSPGCNSLDQGPGILIACCFSPSSEQLRSSSSLGCNSLVQGPSILVACGFAPSSEQPLSVGPAAAMDAARRATQDDRRKSRALAPLLEGRPVQALTRDRRSKLKTSWIGWLADEGYSWEDVGRWARNDVSKLNQVLSRYGKWLYEDGWPYYWLSETINMVSSEFPTVRRFLQQVWDLAQAWQREEPPTHHSALPWQVLAALLSVSITWGWIRVAGIIALAWGGLARIGEVLAAKRKHLVLPADTGDDAQVVYMSVMEPKTRFRAARHQCLKVDQPQLVRLICLAFGNLDPDEKLWLMSPSTLRARFDKLLAALTLTRNLVPGVRDFDLGSLRAGGATWMMQAPSSWLNNLAQEVLVRRRLADLFPATWFVWTFLTVHLVGVAFLTDYAGQSGLLALCATFGLHAGFALSEFALWMLGLDGSDSVGPWSVLVFFCCILYFHSFWMESTVLPPDYITSISLFFPMFPAFNAAVACSCLELFLEWRWFPDYKLWPSFAVLGAALRVKRALIAIASRTADRNYWASCRNMPEEEERPEDFVGLEIPDRRIVQEGVYQYERHPAYLGAMLWGLGIQADLFPATWFVWTFLTVHLVGVAFLTDYAGQSGLLALCATFGLHAGFALSEFALWMLGLDGSDSVGPWSVLVFFCCILYFHSFWMESTVLPPDYITSISLFFPMFPAFNAAVACSCLELFLEWRWFPDYKLWPSFAVLGAAMCAAGQALIAIASRTADRNYWASCRNMPEEEERPEDFVGLEIPDRRIVQEGVYQYERHPAYLGAMLWGLGIQVALCNPVMAVIVGFVLWASLLYVALEEEQELYDEFKGGYANYATLTSCWIPLFNTFLENSAFQREMTDTCEEDHENMQEETEEEGEEEMDDDLRSEDDLLPTWEGVPKGGALWNRQFREPWMLG